MDAHRNPIDPSILLRMASSMEAIKENWDADVLELRRVEGVNASLQADLTRLSDRCDALIVQEREVRERNEFLVKRNAQLEAHLQRLRDATADARDALEANVLRMETVAEETPRDPAPTRSTTAAAPAGEAPPAATDSTESLTGALNQLLDIAPDLSRDLNDGGPDHIPVFLTSPANSSSRLPPNEYGRQHARA